MTIVKEEDGTMPVPDDDHTIFRNKLSPSARAILNALCKLEKGESIELFQQGPESEIKKLKKWVKTYKGGFCTAVRKRIRLVISRGGIVVITQDDIMRLIREMWRDNISRLSSTELQVLEFILQNPELGTIELVEKTNLTYARIRRAKENLQTTGVLQRKGRLNAAPLGLDRILIQLNNPTYVPVSPYFEKTLYIDHPRIVFVVCLTPSGRRKALEQTIKSLRTVSDSVTIWRLSSGQPHFGKAYYNISTKQFKFDPFHFRLSLANDEALLLGDAPPSTVMFPLKLSKADTKVIDELVRNYDSKALEIVQRTSISESTAFRRRARIIKERIVIPRHRVDIPALSDRVLASVSPDSAGRIMQSWIRHLPVTYVSRIENTETNGRDKRVLLASALPKGASQDVIDVLRTEQSRVDDYDIFRVAASTVNVLKVNRMYDTQKRSWKFDSSFIELGSYGICRRDAKSTNIPLDLV
ncbi:MAG: hypothetical protein ACTSQZ_00465 [Candidatus Thorarchaeota archaeon]